ncbi:MAG: hypothetical protein RLZZ385_1494 [Pseudomonadota bacterium]|jgi:hypothetical protein
MTRLFHIIVCLGLGAIPWHATAQSPCESGEHRQLDFWVGQWQVLNADGETVANSDISIQSGGCVILERFRAYSGYSGTSMNHWSADAGWLQLWRDANGVTIQFTGRLQDGAMVFEAEGFTDANGSYRRRMELSAQPGGEVLQISNRSYDSGVSWLPEYRLTYRRIE